MTLKSKDEHSQQNFFSDWNFNWKSSFSPSEKELISDENDLPIIRSKAKIIEKTNRSGSFSSVKDQSPLIDSFSSLTSCFDNHNSLQCLKAEPSFVTSIDGVKTLTDRLESFSLGEKKCK